MAPAGLILSSTAFGYRFPIPILDWRSTNRWHSNDAVFLLSNANMTEFGA